MIEVELPDGSIAEFPDGTPREVMQNAVRKRVAMSSANNSDFARMVSGEPKPMGVGDTLKREAGLGLRYAIEGPVQTAGLFTDPIARAVGLPTAREGTDALTNALRLPQPQGGMERVSGDVSRALTGTLATMGLGSLARPGSALSALAANPGAQVAAATTGGAAAGTAREAGVGPGGQIAAGFAGAFAPGAVGAGSSGLLRMMMRGSQPAAQATLRDFARAGTTPSVGQLGQGRVMRGAESGLAAYPGGAGVIADKAQSQAAQIGARVDDLATGLSPRANSTTAGAQIVKGVTGAGGFIEKFKATSGQLYGAVDQYFPPNTPVAVTNTQAYLAKATAPIAGAPNVSARLANKELDELRSALDADTQAQVVAAQQGALPYEAVKALRSRIGEKIADAGIDPDIGVKQLKRLYAALSEDIKAAVRQSGNPNAAAALSRADMHYRAGSARIDAISAVIQRNGGPEKVFGAALSGTKEGATTLRAVMQSLGAEEQRAVTAAVLKRMGRATSGKQDDLGEVFSTETFLTNYNSMSPEARRALFGRLGPRFNADLDAVAKVASNIRDGSKVYANPSGSGGKVTQISVGVTGAGALAAGNFDIALGVLGSMALANTSARMMTNLKFVRWLADQTRMPPAAAAAQLNVLSQMGKSDPDIAEFAAALKDAGNQQADR